MTFVLLVKAPNAAEAETIAFDTVLNLLSLGEASAEARVVADSRPTHKVPPDRWHVVCHVTPTS